MSELLPYFNLDLYMCYIS